MVIRLSGVAPIPEGTDLLALGYQPDPNADVAFVKADKAAKKNVPSNARSRIY